MYEHWEVMKPIYKMFNMVELHIYNEIRILYHFLVNSIKDLLRSVFNGRSRFNILKNFL